MLTTVYRFYSLYIVTGSTSILGEHSVVRVLVVSLILVYLRLHGPASAPENWAFSGAPSPPRAPPHPVCVHELTFWGRDPHVWEVVFDTS